MTGETLIAEARTCPDCGQVYPHEPDYLHTCAAGVSTFHYFYRLKDDHVVHSLCLVGAKADDPLLAVETLAPDGTTQRWKMTRESGMLVFWPPDGYAGVQGLVMRYSKDVQRHAAAPRELLERYALNNRTSVRV